MYRFAYADVLDEDPAKQRWTEKLAVDRAIELLRAGRQQGSGSIAAIEALDYTRQLWMIFVEDAASSGNDLPADLRAKLVSIGIWILREVDEIRKGNAKSFDDLIEVCEQISEGLN